MIHCSAAGEAALILLQNDSKMLYIMRAICTDLSCIHKMHQSLCKRDTNVYFPVKILKLKMLDVG